MVELATELWASFWRVVIRARDDAEHAVQVALALKKQDLFLEGEPVRTAVLRAM